MALSYCWGGSQRMTTTKQTLGDLSERIPLLELPQSLQDAVFVTRQMGIRYLWVDALCIIQDCEQDKDEQTQHMEVIYQRAYSGRSPPALGPYKNPCCLLARSSMAQG